MYLAGVMLSVIWVALGAYQEVYVGNLVQGADPILLLVVCMAVTGVGALATQIRDLRGLAAIARRNARTLTYLNISTALAWASGFASLRFIDPAAGDTFAFASTPLATFATAFVLGRRLTLARSELIASIGVLVAGGALGVVVMVGQSGVGDISALTAAIGIALALVCGIVSGIHNIWIKQLSDDGARTLQVMGLRFWLLILGGGAWLLVQRPSVQPLVDHAGGIALLTAFGVIAPIFIGQRAIELTEPTTVALITSLMPAVVFGLQQLDTRLAFSWPSMICVLAMVAIVTWDVLARLRPRAAVNAG
jgi:drug/metabolite transporter (DMT)-like permease